MCVIIDYAEDNSLSKGAEVAGIMRYFLASHAIVVNLCSGKLKLAIENL